MLLILLNVGSQNTLYSVHSILVKMRGVSTAGVITVMQ
jgi:hypothetical protein